MGGSFFARGIPVNKTLKRHLKRRFKSKKENEKKPHLDRYRRTSLRNFVQNPSFAESAFFAVLSGQSTGKKKGFFGGFLGFLDRNPILQTVFADNPNFRLLFQKTEEPL